MPAGFFIVETEKMKLAVIAFAFLSVTLFFGCKKQSSNGAASLEDLQQDVLLSYKNHNPDIIGARLYLTGMPSEMQTIALDHICKVAKQNKFTKLNAYATNFFTGHIEMDFNGRRTKWLQEPSHFIVLEGTLPNSNTNLEDGSFESYLAAAKINSRWCSSRLTSSSPE